MSHSLLVRILKINFFHKNFLVCFLFGLVLTVLQAKTENNWTSLGENSAFLHLLGIETTGQGTFIYIFSLPIVSTVCGSRVVANNRMNKQIELICSRVAKPIYLKTSGLAAFLLGGIAAVIPVLMQAWWCFMRYPLIKVDFFSKWFPFPESSDRLAQLFAFHPLSFWLLMLFFYFCLGGTFAFIGCSCSLVSEIKYLEITVPFLFCLLTWLLGSQLSLIQLSPFIWSAFSYSEIFAGKDTLSPWLIMGLEGLGSWVIGCYLFYRGVQSSA